MESFTKKYGEVFFPEFNPQRKAQRESLQRNFGPSREHGRGGAPPKETWTDKAAPDANLTVRTWCLHVSTMPRTVEDLRTEYAILSIMWLLAKMRQAGRQLYRKLTAINFLFQRQLADKTLVGPYAHEAPALQRSTPPQPPGTVPEVPLHLFCFFGAPRSALLSRVSLRDFPVVVPGPVLPRALHFTLVQCVHLVLEQMAPGRRNLVFLQTTVGVPIPAGFRTNSASTHTVHLGPGTPVARQSWEGLDPVRSWWEHPRSSLHTYRLDDLSLCTWHSSGAWWRGYGWYAGVELEDHGTTPANTDRTVSSSSFSL